MSQAQNRRSIGRIIRTMALVSIAIAVLAAIAVLMWVLIERGAMDLPVTL